MNNIMNETKAAKVFFSFIDKKFANSTHIYDTIYDQETKNNIENIEKKFSFDKLVLVNQVHGSDVYFYKKAYDTESDDKFITADGLITSKKNIAIAVKTADCAPVLISDFSGSVVCAIHCGWRGALSDLIKKSISMLNEISLDKKYSAIIGPCISKENYEVDEKFMDNFLQESDLNKQFFHIIKSNIQNNLQENKNSKDSGDKIFFDLPSYTKHKLMMNGISEVEIIPECTFSNEELYPSYRRENKKGLTCKQRMLSVVCIK